MIVKTYIPQIHDIHLYNPEAVYTPPNQATCPCCCNGVPVAYNPQCQGAAVDWSGVSLRERSFYRRGISPTAPPPQGYIESSINWYNTGVPCAVLITPKHALITQHYRGTNPNPNPNESYTFLGKSGTKYSRSVSSVTLSVGPDHTLLEFSESLPVDDVKVYNKIADVQYIPTGRDLFLHECNGKCIKVKMGVATWWPPSNPPVDYTGYSWVISPSPNGINQAPGNCAGGCPLSNGVFTGDSGSPMFVLDKYNNTVLIGLSFGGSFIGSQELNTINNIISTQGYNISYTKISARASDFNQDGNVDGSDIGFLQANYGLNNSIADLNLDGIVDGADLGVLLTEYGSYTIQPNATRPPPQ